MRPPDLREFEPVRATFHGWRERTGNRVTTHDGAFPSVNDIGISARAGNGKNWPYINAKAIYSIMVSALLREPPGSEYQFVKPGTKGVRCTMLVDRDGDLPTGAGFVLLEGACVWPDLIERDQQNYAAIIWKFVPDVLEADGYLTARDDWLGLQCGNLERRLHRGAPARTEIVFLPARDRLALVDESVSVAGLF